MLTACDSKWKGEYFNVHFQSAFNNHIQYSISHQIGALGTPFQITIAEGPRFDQA